MDSEIIKKYKKAGEIAKAACKYAETLCLEGAKLVEIADKIETKIKDLGGKCAFPVNLSVNEFAAHYVPSFDEKTILKKDDLLKVDIGVHIDGYIADTAFSVSIGKNEENNQLISAAKDALSAAIAKLKPGAEAAKVGAEIDRVAKSHGFRPIYNLTGHSLNQYELHASPSIPNYDSGRAIIKEGTAVAIEPFITNRDGYVIEGKDAEVFQLIDDKGSIRIGRDVYEFIKKEYITLPFARRWLVKKFGSLKTNLALKQLIANGLIKDFKVLREKDRGKVAQAEHTILVLNEKIITTE